MGIFRDLFVIGQYANAGDDEEKLNEIREQERNYMEYQMRQDKAVDEFFEKIGRFFK